MGLSGRVRQMDDLLAGFLADAADHLGAIEGAVLRADTGDGAAHKDALTRLAALKGQAASLGLHRVERISQAAESLLGGQGEARALLLRALLRLRDILAAIDQAGFEPPGDDGDLIAAGAMDRLPSLADMLTSARDRLMEISAQDRDPRLSALLSRLSSLGAELADATRTKPIAECYSALPDMAQRAARQEGKRVALMFDGDLAIDEGAIAPLSEALTHLVRNACRHGIEAAELRRAFGKPETGRIRIIAYRGEDCSIIEVSDDGRGFDFGAVRQAVIRKGVLPADAVNRMADAEIARLALTPGIANAAEAGLAGRAEGLEAARAAIMQLGGELTISASTPRGATFTITLPDIGAELSSGAMATHMPLTGARR